jgi:hypothetical protein
MNTLLHWFVLGIIILGLSYCTKKADTASSNSAATMQVINGAVNSPILLKINGSINSSGVDRGALIRRVISFGSAYVFFTGGEIQPIEVLRSTDSVSLASKTCEFKKGGIYTVLVAGILPNVDLVLIDDTNLPYVDLSTSPAPADSVINVRFINLVPDMQNVDVRISGAGKNEVAGLAFKAASPWISYAAKISNGSYTFQFVENGVVQQSTTLTINATNRFKNVALVMRGMKTPGAGQPGLAVTAVNYFQ